MSSAAVEAMFAARAYDEGRAFRRASLRHAHLAESPFGICVWRLGGERFRAAAIAWGELSGDFQIAVAGEPRNRDLYFSALIPFAHDLCRAIDRRSSTRVARQRGSRTDYIPSDALQVVVPNRATANAITLLGRYLGYLTDRGGVVPDPRLIEAGRHLRFLGRHARVPGQSLLVSLDRLLSDHWATALSPFEQSNLAVLDAHIAPEGGLHPFEAGLRAEATIPLGPEPTEEIDRVTEDLLGRFNAERGGATDAATVTPLLSPLEDHYRQLVEPVWSLMGRALERERQYPAAPSVSRRYAVDREAFGRHCDWISGGGRYKTRDTARQAVISLRSLEDAQRRFEAERAVEDPVCMVPYLLEGKAIRGVVRSVVESSVRVRIRPVPRAVITLDTDCPVVLPVGKRLWWTATAGDKYWDVLEVSDQSGASRVTLMLSARPTPERLPGVGDTVTFSSLHTDAGHFSPMPPRAAPWTHVSPEGIAELPDIDVSGIEEEAEDE